MLPAKPYIHHLPDAQGPLIPPPHVPAPPCPPFDCHQKPSQRLVCHQDPIDSNPAVLVKRSNVTQQKELEEQLSNQQEVLQR